MPKKAEIVPPSDFAQVEIFFTEGPSVTVAEVDFFGFSASGESRRMPEDQHDPAVGRTVALGRALTELGEDLTRFGVNRSHIH